MLMCVLLFPFLEQKRCSYFPEVPSLHLTKFLSHVLSNSRTRTVAARSRSSVLVAAHDPGRDDRRILVCNEPILVAVALGIPDGDSVHRSEPDLYNFVRRDAHDVSPFGRTRF